MTPLGDAIVGAASLFDRLAAADGAAAGPDVEELLSAWADAYSRGDRGALDARLAWDGLDRDRLRGAFALTSLPRPKWADGMSALLEAAREGPGDVPARLESVPVPFVELWLCFARHARTELERRVPDLGAGLGVEARTAFEIQLVRELSASGELALHERFRARGGSYASFIRGLREHGLRDLMEEYPVLARHWAVLVDQWIDAVAELVRRLAADRAALVAWLGEAAGSVVQRAEAGLSDRHHGGRRVAALEWAPGIRVVYKPRDVTLERAFQELLRDLGALGLVPAPRALVVLAREGYGWVEHAATGVFTGRKTVAAYYQRAGQLLALAHVLGAKDLHHENVIATTQGPVLIDTEVMVGPTPWPRTAEAEAADATCLDSGLLSLVSLDADGRAVDGGGLRSSVGRRLALPRRVWKALGTDELSFEEETVSRPRLAGNEVRLEGVPQAPEDHAADVLAGFRAAYRLLLRERDRLLDDGGPLAAFAQGRTRVVLRPSDQYATLLRVLAAPRYQRSGIERSLALDALNRAFARLRERPLLWPMAIAERAALERLDIPRFALATTEVVMAFEGGGRAPGYFSASGLDALRARVARLSEPELGVQEAWLQAALRAAPVAAGVEARAEWLAAADVLARGLHQNAVVHDRVAAWPVCRDRMDLYGGTCGIALFLAAHARITGDGESRRLAKAAVAAVGRRVRAGGAGLWQGSGAANGAGSGIYALTWLGRLLDDEGAVSLATHIARALETQSPRDEPEVDVVSGTAGAVLALVALARQTRLDWPRQMARDWADEILRRQIADGALAGGWRGADGQVRAGFGHGLAGVIAALAALHREAPDAALAEAMSRGRACEAALYSPAHANWPVTEDGTVREVMTAWCHGAPGVALARLGTPDDPDLASALEATMAASPGLHDHLCCGRLARSEVLLVAANALPGRPSLLETSRRLAADVARRACEGGWPAVRTIGFDNRRFNPGFFLGIAGVGYHFLRQAAPDGLPSVLAFDPPAAS